MNYDEVNDFQTNQKDIVAMIGAFLVPLKAFSESLLEDGFDASVEIRKLQPIVSEFSSKLGILGKFCSTYHYPTYSLEVTRPTTRISQLIGNQTLPSKKLSLEDFKSQFDIHMNGISEVMIAVAQIVTPTVDANIRAGNSFSAYCFFSSLLEGAGSNVQLIDPYIDHEIFYRYLYRLPAETFVKVTTDQSNLKEPKLSQLLSVEKLFKAEYPNYTRFQKDNLHDRYLVTDTKAYALGGSLKDAAKKSDFSIIEVSDEKRNELLQIYA